MRSLRLPGEGDAEFRQRARRAAVYARVLVDSCLANRDVQALIADPQFPYYTEEGFRRSPTVRIDYDQAFAIAGIGEGLQATRSKHWGDGPQILPLEPDDPVWPTRILYVYKEHSLYNRRFEQRRRMKALLGKPFRPLVEMAKRHTKQVFLDALTAQQALAIRRILQVDPTRFWQCCKGCAFVDLPKPSETIDPATIPVVADKPQQLMLPFTDWQQHAEYVRRLVSQEADEDQNDKH